MNDSFSSAAVATSTFGLGPDVTTTAAAASVFAPVTAYSSFSSSSIPQSQFVPDTDDLANGRFRR